METSEIITIGDCYSRFKSYYVVWKPVGLLAGVAKNARLNRTM